MKSEIRNRRLDRPKPVVRILTLTRFSTPVIVMDVDTLCNSRQGGWIASEIHLSRVRSVRRGKLKRKEMMDDGMGQRGVRGCKEGADIVEGCLGCHGDL